MNNPWRVQRGLLDFLSYGPTASIASQLLKSRTVRLVLDYMITMEPDGSAGSPCKLNPKPMTTTFAMT